MNITLQKSAEKLQAEQPNGRVTFFILRVDAFLERSFPSRQFAGGDEERKQRCQEAHVGQGENKTNQQCCNTHKKTLRQKYIIHYNKTLP